MITLYEQKLGFPEEASAFFEESYARMLRVDGAASLIDEAKDDLFNGSGERCGVLLGMIAERSGVHRYTVDMIFLLTSLSRLSELYAKKGYSEELFLDTMRDLTVKLYECRIVFGVWGTFVLPWYISFFKLNIFAFGRLQFERKAFPIDDYKGILHKGDKVFSCHIPSASGPLLYSSVMDSLKRAHAFFEKELKDGILPVYCHSWLLYPPHAPLFPTGSNLERFYGLFDIVASESDPTSKDFPRIFGVPYSAETVKNVAEDNTLRRNFKKYMCDGNLMGLGHGILLFDGEGIIRPPEK